MWIVLFGNNFVKVSALKKVLKVLLFGCLSESQYCLVISVSGWYELYKIV